MTIVCVAVDNWGNVGVIVRTERGYKMFITSSWLCPQSFSRYGLMFKRDQKSERVWETTKKFYPDGIT